METDTMPTELRLAAIIALLSSSALRGATAGKAEALREHLEAAALSSGVLDPHLRNAHEDALAEWLTVERHEKSVAVPFCAMAARGRALH